MLLHTALVAYIHVGCISKCIVLIFCKLTLFEVITAKDSEGGPTPEVLATVNLMAGGASPPWRLKVLVYFIKKKI